MCKARVIGDQFNCRECALWWDLNDDDQPECRLVAKQKTGHEALAAARRLLADVSKNQSTTTAGKPMATPTHISVITLPVDSLNKKIIPT